MDKPADRFSAIGAVPDGIGAAVCSARAAFVGHASLDAAEMRAIPMSDSGPTPEQFAEIIAANDRLMRNAAALLIAYADLCQSPAVDKGFRLLVGCDTVAALQMFVAREARSQSGDDALQAELRKKGGANGN